MFTAALSMDAAAHSSVPYSLETIKEALISPVFVPYFGRKACPLGLPMCPEIYNTEHVTDAFSKYSITRFLPEPMQEHVSKSQTMRILADEPMLPQKHELIFRRDNIKSRTRWQFEDRNIAVLTITEKGSNSDE
jgi:CRISPR system Cascade subunit CasD